MAEIETISGTTVIVDNDDYEWLNQYRWYSLPCGYSYRRPTIDGEQITIYMHREITNAPTGMEVDHINHNGLDNRRCNLRVCTHSQNLTNSTPNKISRQTTVSSPYTGVQRYTGHLWYSNITLNGITIKLGGYTSARLAAMVYDLFAREYHCEYAKLNFPGVGIDTLKAELKAERLRLVELQSKKRAMRVGEKYSHAKSKYIGVTPQQGGYIAKINTPNGRKYLGYYKTEIDAARAYDKVASEVYGDNARLNGA